MYVMKRDGKQQPVSFDRITERIAELTEGTTVCTRTNPTTA